MLDKLNNILSKIVCFLFGHQNYRKIYTGKIGYYTAGQIGSQAVPVMDRGRLNFCQRCGKPLGPTDNLDKNENYRGL